MKKLILSVLAVVAGCSAPGPVAPAPVSLDRLIELHNKARSESVWHLSPLEKDPKLMAYAQSHADWMAANDRMVHSSISKVMALGYSTAGENIAWGQETEEGVVRAWMFSPGHRWNILGGSYTRIGCGAAVRDGRIFWCVNFGRPQ